MRSSTMMSQETVTAAPPTLLATLAQHGWARYVAGRAGADAVVSDIGRIGSLLGKRAVGRSGALAEVVQPPMPDDAQPRSQSAQYGLNDLPFPPETGSTPGREGGGQY